MAVVRPFRGVRPKAEFAQKVASPPYDVLSSDEARELVKENPLSFLRVNKSEVDFPSEIDMYSRQVYEKGKQNLQSLMRENILIQDDQPCFYLYRLTMNSRAQTGLVALTSVDEYDRGIIKKHEHTRPDKVKDRADHIQILEAQVGPVFSIFKHNAELTNLFAKLTAGSKTLDFVADDHIRHELWVIADQSAIDALVSAFGRLSAIYIADGHHRSQAASEVARRLREANPQHTGNEHYNFFLNVLFPDTEVHIMPYNRVMSDTNCLSVEALLDRAGKNYSVTNHQSPVEPRQNHQVGLYVDRRWYVLSSREGTYDESHPAESIDSAILTRNFLSPLLGITNIRTDKRIDFVGGIRGVSELVKLVDGNKYKIAFSLYPVSVDQLIDVADAGEVMPPKSTWFEPKLRDGVVINLLNEK